MLLDIRGLSDMLTMSVVATEFVTWRLAICMQYGTLNFIAHGELHLIYRADGKHFGTQIESFPLCIERINSPRHYEGIFGCKVLHDVPL